MLRELRLGTAWMLALSCACDLGTRAGPDEFGDGATGPGDASGSGTTGEVPTLACAEQDPAKMIDAHSFLDDGGQCWCEDGYTWNDPFDPNDYACHEVAPRLLACGQACDATAIGSGQIACEGDTEGEPFTQDQACDCPVGETWCAPDDPKDEGPKDTRCCRDGAQQPAVGGSSSETGTTASGGTTGAGDSSSGGTTAPGTSEQ